jgi:hypothetical protein
VGRVVPQVPLEATELKGDIEFVIDKDKVMVGLTALKNGPTKLLVENDDKALVELVVTLGIIEDETTEGLTATDTGEVVIFWPSMDELRRLVKPIPPTGIDVNVLESSE